MKKILLVCLIFVLSQAFAEYIDFTEAIKSTSMPSDAEIRQVLKKYFDFTPEQENDALKEVKVKLKQMYLSNDMEKNNLELNRYFNQINNEAVGVFMNETTKRQFLHDVAKYY